MYTYCTSCAMLAACSPFHCRNDEEPDPHRCRSRSASLAGRMKAVHGSAIQRPKRHFADIFRRLPHSAAVCSTPARYRKYESPNQKPFDRKHRDVARLLGRTTRSAVYNAPAAVRDTCARSLGRLQFPVEPPLVGRAHSLGWDRHELGHLVRVQFSNRGFQRVEQPPRGLDET